jgi:Golgi SNAP receptor complex protein 1
MACLNIQKRKLHALKLNSTNMATYDSLRRQSRTLESLVDAKLTAYSRLASSISLGQDVEAGGSAARREDMEQEIEGLFEKAQLS